jgi:hypothetical protein
LLDTLDPNQIVGRLQELDREARALRVLLKAARVRRRAAQQLSSDHHQGGGRDAT